VTLSEVASALGASNTHAATRRRLRKRECASEKPRNRPAGDKREVQDDTGVTYPRHKLGSGMLQQKEGKPVLGLT
jgi:hypothetical protein